MRVALYARVSTGKQAEEGLSIAAQLAEMEEFARQRGWTEVARFVDPGHSGSTLDRPGVQEMLYAVRRKSFDILLVHELSRLSRSIFDTFRLFEELGKLDIGFASVKDPQFDFSNPASRLFLTIMAALHQYYLDQLRQHVAKSKRQRAREGLYNASVIPYGYRRGSDPRQPPQVEPREAAGVRLAFELYATGNYSFQQVAERLYDAGYRTRQGRPFSKDTIDDLLRNRFYTGQVVYRVKKKGRGQEPEVYEGQHEGIVSLETFEACQRAMRKRRSGSRTYQASYRTYLLNGIAVCDICGRRLRAQATRSNRYYREMSRARGHLDCPQAQVGTAAGPVEQQVGAVFRHLRLPDDWQQRLEVLLDRSEEQEALENRRARLLAERRRLHELYVRGYLGDDMSLYERETQRIQRELERLPTTDLESIQWAASTLESMAQVWDAATLEEQRDLVRLALREVQIDVGQPRVNALVPYPPFVPLFRQVEWLIETDAGRFVPLWPPEMAEQLSADPPLPPLADPLPPEEWLAWPLVTEWAQALEGPPDRISPQASAFLKERSRAGRPVQAMVDVTVPGMFALKVDARKWPGVQVERYSRESAREVFGRATGSVSFLRTPFLLQPASAREEGMQGDWLQEAARLLDEGGWWVIRDVLPEGMAGHWLYRHFPEAWGDARQKNWGAGSLFVALRDLGFRVELRRRHCYQAVRGDVACSLARAWVETEAGQAIPRAAVAEGLACLERAAQEETWLASQVCVMEVIARKGHAK